MEGQGEGSFIRFVDGATVTKYLDPEELILALEKGFVNFSSESSDIVQPVRTAVGVKKHAGTLLVMPAYSGSENALATKLVTLYPGNVDRGLPAHNGVVINFDPENGIPNAILDAEAVTDLRTAAATAVATKYLAREDAKILAIIGSGHQARSHFRLLSLVRNFSEVRIWSRSIEKAGKLANEIGAKAFSSVQEAVKDADVIVTVTMSQEPVVFGKWTKSDCLINVVGACRPTWREVDDDVMLNSQVVVDTRSGAEEESGDVILSKATIVGEIGHVISGAVKINMNDRRVFKSLGMALEDAIAAKLVMTNISKT